MTQVILDPGSPNIRPICSDILLFSKKSPTGPTERTPKPEYLIALATCLGVRWGSVDHDQVARSYQRWNADAGWTHFSVLTSNSNHGGWNKPRGGGNWNILSYFHRDPWGFMIQFDESYVSNWVEMFTNYKWLNIFCRGRSWRKGSITNEKFILPIWTMLAFPGVSFISYKSIRCAWAIARHVKRDLEHHSEKRSLVMFVMHSEPKWTSEPFCSCLEMILKHVSCIQELELQNRLIMAWLLFGIMSSRQ